MKNVSKIILNSLVALSFISSTYSQIKPLKKKPNFVVILTDDQGWNALSTRMDPDIPGSGSTYYRTPNLDRLAKEGMRFSRAYSSAPTCSPTRHSIQFGRSPASLQIWEADGIKRKNIDAKPAEAMANILKKHHPEYKAAHYGKWHISYTPEALGFEYNDGANKNLKRSKDNVNDPKYTFSLSKKATGFIEERVKKEEPFLLQVSYYADHLFFEAKKETLEKYTYKRSNLKTAYQNNPVWAAMNEDLDTGIGRVLQKIKDLGIEDNTYIIFTSDNGYESKLDGKKSVGERGYYKAYPLRSHKYKVSEGGLRVPFIIKGPGISANTISRKPVVSTDIYPTIMSILGLSKELPKKIEGGSLIKHIKSKGKQPIKRKNPFLTFRYSKSGASKDIVIMQDEFKLLRAINEKKLYLWNITKDMGESHNLTDEKPELTKQMLQKMTNYFKRFGRDD